MQLTITLTIAAAAVVLNLWLAMRVGALRHASGIAYGDGGNQRLIARMRAHANFHEHVALVLILLAGLELTLGSSLWLWAAGGLFMLARLAHMFGMDGIAPGPLRGGGIAVTFAVELGLAITAIIAVSAKLA